ncbi:MAG: peptidoglycan-binding domain-containing protein [Asticcacaulis sp.]
MRKLNFGAGISMCAVAALTLTAGLSGTALAHGHKTSPRDVQTETLPELRPYHEGSSVSVESRDELPADLRAIARPGQCYARLLKAPEFETFNEKVIVAEARTERRVIPAVTRTVTETQVVEEATYYEERIPAEYEVRHEHVMVREPSVQWETTRGHATGAALVTPHDHQPVRYRADGTLNWPGKQDVLVRTSHDTTAYLQQGSAQTIYCLTETPSEYKKVKRKVQVRPESVRRVEVPAKVRQVERTVIDQPERVVEEHIPAVYDRVERTRVLREPEPVWREVLCERNASPETVRAIQTALQRRGYNPGRIDGNLGTQTVAAMQKFQADSGLAQGQISLEAVEALGVRVR